MRALLLTFTALCAAAFSTSAHASEFDGSWVLEHHTLLGAGEVCLSYQTVSGCVPMSAELSLEGGAVTAESLHLLADDLLDELEALTGRDVPTRAEDRLHAAIDVLYTQAEDSLGQAVAALPDRMDIDQNTRREEAILATLSGEDGEMMQLPGVLDPDTGAFTLGELVEGCIYRDQDYTGKGEAKLNLAEIFTKEGLTLSLTATAELAFSMTPAP